MRRVGAVIEIDLGDNRETRNRENERSTARCPREI